MAPKVTLQSIKSSKIVKNKTLWKNNKKQNKTKQTNNQDSDQLDVVCEFEQVSLEL
jgi:hypothetical protein